jgi:hypothetical protein
MVSNLFVTAIRDNEYISIDEFNPKDGAKCNCTCPECGEKVQANVTSKTNEELKRNYTNHFSHINKDSKCKGGYLETELHLFAKEAIEKSNSIKVPTKKYHFPRELKINSVKVEPSFPFENCKQYRPDLIIYDDQNEQIAIEIFVTNNLSEVKQNLYREKEFKCLKIDLSEFKKVDLDSNRKTIEEAILNNDKNKKWIYPTILNESDKLNTDTTKSKSNPSGCIVIFIPIISFFVYYFLK